MQDVGLDTGNDLVFLNGDFQVIESTYQEVKTILENPPGTFKLDGFLGIDLSNELDDDGNSNFNAELKKQLKRDNKKLIRYAIQNGKLLLDVENI